MVMVQRSVRHQCWRNISGTIARICVSAIALLVHATLVYAAPDVVLMPTGDKALDDALRSSLNVPELVHVVDPNSANAQQDWQSTLRTEQLRLAQILKGRGYLQGTVNLSHLDAISKPAALPPLELRPVPGPLFRIGSVEVAGIDDSGLAALRDDVRSQMANIVGKPAQADLLSYLESEVLWRVMGASYPLARVSGREVVPDPATQLASVRLVIDKGPAARFGAVTYDGLKHISSKQLESIAPFSSGSPYDPELLGRFAQALNAMPGIASARVHLADRQSPDGRIPVNVQIAERATVPAGIAFVGSVGAAALAFAIFALAFRQLAIVGGPSERRRAMVAMDIVLLPLFLAAAAFVLLRLGEFAFPT
ncbi:hypothetical protein [Mesorhizobium sp. ANAO-SY3R2]|uniref:hypothetical protein n=1 Tax=Mesorhizobium sp. ANAO-SY3R2 TaxID=3166644 RepID=UPI00366B9C8A